MGSVTIREAVRADNEALLALTSASPMDGTIAVRVDRQPDFFGLIDRRGTGVVLVAERDGALVGCLSATLVAVRVDGEDQHVHFLGDFKLRPDYRKSGLAVRLLRAMHQRVSAAGGDLVIGLTAYGNRDVAPFFNGRAGLLTSTSLGHFNILQIIPGRRRAVSSTLAVAEEVVSAELINLYDEQIRKYQFGPVVTSDFLRGTQHWTARDAQGRLAAAVALLDVSSLRQNILIRLPPALRLAAIALRAVGGFLPGGGVPKEGGPVRSLYVKAMAFQPGHESALDLLIQQARFAAHKGRYHFLSIGLHERDPLNRHFAWMPKFTFKTTGFIVTLQGREADLKTLAARLPYQDLSLG